MDRCARCVEDPCSRTRSAAIALPIRSTAAAWRPECSASTPSRCRASAWPGVLSHTARYNASVSASAPLHGAGGRGRSPGIRSAWARTPRKSAPRTCRNHPEPNVLSDLAAAGSTGWGPSPGRDSLVNGPRLRFIAAERDPEILAIALLLWLGYSFLQVMRTGEEAGVAPTIHQRAGTWLSPPCQTQRRRRRGWRGFRRC